MPLVHPLFWENSKKSSNATRPKQACGSFHFWALLQTVLIGSGLSETLQCWDPDLGSSVQGGGNRTSSNLSFRHLAMKFAQWGAYTCLGKTDTPLLSLEWQFTGSHWHKNQRWWPVRTGLWTLWPGCVQAQMSADSGRAARTFLWAQFTLSFMYPDLLIPQALTSLFLTFLHHRQRSATLLILLTTESSFTSRLESVPGIISCHTVVWGLLLAPICPVKTHLYIGPHCISHLPLGILETLNTLPPQNNPLSFSHFQ